jgi:hypothetical protein
VSLSGTRATPFTVAGSASETVRVSWKSDGSGVAVGFLATWWSVCLAGTYAAPAPSNASAVECVPCAAPSGWYCPVGSTTVVGVPCPAGRYSVGGVTSCVNCTAPLDSSCEEGSDSSLGTPCAAGFTSGGGTARCVLGCSGRRAQRGAGVVRNPVVGTTYTNNEACEWLLEADVDHVVSITVLSFSSERDYDVLRVMDGNLTTSRVCCR